MNVFKRTAAMLMPAAILTLGACKKDTTTTTPNACMITTIGPPQATADNAYHLSYNKDGSVNTISYGPLISTYSYNGNIITAISRMSGVFYTRSTITLNAQGLATTVKSETKEDGSEWSLITNEFTGEEVTKSTLTASNGTTAVTTYEWSQQNLVAIHDGSTTSTLEYYTDKPSAIGDYLSLLQLITGYPIYHSKNLIRSLRSGADVTDVEYTFDGEGRIVALAIRTNTGSNSLNYGYQCNP